MSDPNDRQVGGDHYRKGGIQHWDFVVSHDYGYLEGQVSKYLARWRNKNGLQDLDKSLHFLEKIVSVHRQAEASANGLRPIPIETFFAANRVPPQEQVIFLLLHAYHESNDLTFAESALLWLRTLRAGAEPPKPDGV
jgi:hypothetical protein